MSAGDRVAVLLGLRIGGGVLALLGLWMLLGGSLGGSYGFGGVLVACGLAGLILFPWWLARRWKMPR